MKEAIRMVLESIYDPEFPDTSHFRSRRGCHSVLRRIKEEWVSSRWFLEFDIRNHTIDRHRLVSILKEEIDDPKFFDSIQKVFSAGRLVGGEKGPYSVPHSVLLSALPGNIYLHKLDQDIGRIRQKYEIPIVHRMRALLLRTGCIDDQEHYGEEGSFKAHQDKRAIRVKSMQDRSSFHSLLSSWHTLPTSNPRLMGDQKGSFLFHPSLALAIFLNKASSILCAADGLTPKSGREGCNIGHERMKSCKRKGLLIELGGEEILMLRSERGLARKLAPFKSYYKIRISYARYADNLLLGIVGAVELLIEIEKRINHFLQSGLNLLVDSAGSRRIAARSTVEFLGTVIRGVPPATTPKQFLRELEKRLRVKHRIHITACHLGSTIHSKLRNLGQTIPTKELTKGMSGRESLLDAAQLAETLGRAGVRSPQVSVLWGTIKHIRQGSGAISFLHSSGRSKGPSDVQEAVSRSGTHGRKWSLSTPALRKAAGEGRVEWARSSSSEFPIEMEAPIKKIVRRLRDRGLISRRRPWPIHVACLTNVSDEDIVNWSAGIAISPLSYYRCRDNLYQVRRIVDHQIRWSAIFTPAHKHKSSARNIIPKYSKDSNRINQEGALSEFPKSIELGKLGSGQDPKKKVNY